MSAGWWTRKVVPYLKGSLRSWTMHVNTYIMMLSAALSSPTVVQTIADNLPMVQAYLPGPVFMKACGVVAFVNFLLRIKTSTSLADKAKKGNPDA